MKFSFGSSSSNRSVLSATVALILILAHLNISQGLQCYNCIFMENGPPGVSSAGCENIPMFSTNLVNATAGSFSPLSASPSVFQILTEKRKSNTGISVPAIQPNATFSATENIRSDNDTDVKYLYCGMAKFNLKDVGRVVIRGHDTIDQDMGPSYCATKVPSNLGFNESLITDFNLCYCNTSACNGADFVGRSISLFLISTGLAIMSAYSYISH